MIRYRSGYKYQLAETYVVKIVIRPGKHIETEFIDLDMDGELTIRRAYAWDGPTGVWFFKRKLMRPSLVHDGVCQLIRMGLLPQCCRILADEEYRRMSLENKVWSWRAGWQYFVVHLVKSASDPKNRKKVKSAP